MTKRRRKSRVIVTRGFELDIERIDRFLDRSAATHRLDELLEDLQERVIPLLERTPRVGPRFVRSTLSAESGLLFERIVARLRAREARTLVRGDFMLVYVVSDEATHLVGLRHHRESGFTFGQGT